MSTLVRLERSQRSVSVQIARACITAGVAASSRNSLESAAYFGDAVLELQKIIDELKHEGDCRASI